MSALTRYAGQLALLCLFGRAGHGFQPPGSLAPSSPIICMNTQRSETHSSHVG